MQTRFYTDAFYFRGLSRDNNGDSDGALQDYGEAVRLQPENAVSLRMRGRERERAATSREQTPISGNRSGIRLRPVHKYSLIHFVIRSTLPADGELLPSNLSCSQCARKPESNVRLYHERYQQSAGFLC